MTRLKKLRFIEFLVIGVLVGVVEDLLAIFFATGVVINGKVILIAFLVAVPFAFLSEVVVDHPRFWEKIFPDRSFPKDEVARKS